MAGGKALIPVLLLTALLVGCSGEEASKSAAPGGRSAENKVDFTLPDLNGTPIRLSDYRGMTVVVDFWATWCPPCVFQVPELNKFWRRHKDTGDVMVIGVAVDVDGAAVVAPWAEEQNVEYQLVIGDEGVARDFGALGFPTLVIVNPDGEIDSLHVGLIESDELEELVGANRGVHST